VVACASRHGPQPGALLRYRLSERPSKSRAHARNGFRPTWRVRLVESGEALVLAGRYLELAVRDTAVAPERIHHGRALAALARVREKLEDLAGATIAVREALEILTIDSEPIGCAHAAQQLAWLKAQEHDWEESAAAYRKAVAATDLVFYARLETTSREADIRTAGNVCRWAAFAIAKAGALHEALLVLEGWRTREFRRRYGLTSVDHELLGALPPALRDEYLASAYATASAPLGAPAAAPRPASSGDSHQDPSADWV